MGIRRINRRQGLSLTELAFGLLIVGLVLGVLWLKVGDLYKSMDAEKGAKELQLFIQAVRLTQESKQEIPETPNVVGLPPDMFGNFKGRNIIFNPWRGTVSVFQGNAFAGGGDKINKEFTVKFEGVPRSACTSFVMHSIGTAQQRIGLVTVLISNSKNVGGAMCFAEDTYCKNTITVPPENYVAALCKAGNPMTVMFTYAL